MINRKKEKGWIEVWPIMMLRAVTLWRIGPFRNILLWSRKT